MNIPQNLQALNKKNELNVTLSLTQLQNNGQHENYSSLFPFIILEL
jgi:hypothetical protein